VEKIYCGSEGNVILRGSRQLSGRGEMTSRRGVHQWNGSRHSTKRWTGTAKLTLPPVRNS